MGEVINLFERLKNEKNGITYHSGRFPIFEGKVTAVAAEVILTSGSYTGHCSLVDFLPKGAKLPKPSVTMMFDHAAREKFEKIYTKSLKRAVVPLSVNPVIFNGAFVKGHIDDIGGMDCYILELLKDENISDNARDGGALAGRLLGSKYEGFKYIVQL